MKRSITLFLALLLALMLAAPLAQAAEGPGYWAPNMVYDKVEPTADVNGNPYYLPIQLPNFGEGSVGDWVWNREIPAHNLNFTINDLTGLAYTTAYYNLDTYKVELAPNAILTLNAYQKGNILLSREVDWQQGTFQIDGALDFGVWDHWINVPKPSADANIHFGIGVSVDANGMGVVNFDGQIIDSNSDEVRFARMGSNIKMHASAKEGYMFTGWEVTTALEDADQHYRYWPYAPYIPAPHGALAAQETVLVDNDLPELFWRNNKNTSNVRSDNNDLYFNNVSRNLHVIAHFEEIPEVEPVTTPEPEEYFNVVYKYRNAQGVWVEDKQTVRHWHNAVMPNVLENVKVPAETSVSDATNAYLTLTGWEYYKDHRNLQGTVSSRYVRNLSNRVHHDMVFEAQYEEHKPEPTVVPAPTPTVAPTRPAPTPATPAIESTKVSELRPLHFVNEFGNPITSLRLCIDKKVKVLRVADLNGKLVSASFKISNTKLAKMTTKTKARGLKKGVTTVVATTADGRRAVLRLYVDKDNTLGILDDYDSVTSIKLNATKKTLKLKNPTVGFEVKVISYLPTYANLYEGFALTTSNNTVLSYDAATNKFYPLKKGKCTVTYTWTKDDQLSVSASCVITVK